jgi:hypothetical protein
VILSNTDDNYGFALIVANMLEFARGLEIPTSVHLKHFTAERDNADVILRWEVTDAHNHLGFHIWRGDDPGKARRITDSVVKGQGSYEHIDRNAPTVRVVYWLQEVEEDGDTHFLGSSAVPARIPARGYLSSTSFPNPFNPRVTISFRLPAESKVTVTLFDATGRTVATILNETMPAGTHKCVWDGVGDDGGAIASGTYFYTIQAGKMSTAGKMTLLK